MRAHNYYFSLNIHAIRTKIVGTSADFAALFGIREAKKGVTAVTALTGKGCRG